MNRDDAKQAIDLLQAYLDGEEIEERDVGDDWHPCVTLLVGALEYEYRIKPKPEEFWLCWSYDGDNPTVYLCSEYSEYSVNHHHKYIKVREVDDESTKDI